MATAEKKKILVYGGKGALGSKVVSIFQGKGWAVISVDLAANEEADYNVIVVPSGSWQEEARTVTEKVTESVGNDKLHGLFCVAGGWMGGNAAAEDIIKSADLMWKQSVWPSLISSTIASKYLHPDGIMVLTGTIPALGGTPTMIGYGMAKAAVHQLVLSLAAKGSGLPEGSKTIAILPLTLDTPQNRKYKRPLDTQNWTPCETVAEYFFKWSNGHECPANGSLVQLHTKGNKTTALIDNGQ